MNDVTKIWQTKGHRPSLSPDVAVLAMKIRGIKGPWTNESILVLIGWRDEANIWPETCENSLYRRRYGVQEKSAYMFRKPLER